MEPSPVNTLQGLPLLDSFRSPLFFLCFLFLHYYFISWTSFKIFNPQHRYFFWHLVIIPFSIHFYPLLSKINHQCLLSTPSNTSIALIDIRFFRHLQSIITNIITKTNCKLYLILVHYTEQYSNLYCNSCLFIYPIIIHCVIWLIFFSMTTL